MITLLAAAPAAAQHRVPRMCVAAPPPQNPTTPIGFPISSNGVLNRRVIDPRFRANDGFANRRFQQRFRGSSIVYVPYALDYGSYGAGQVYDVAADGSCQFRPFDWGMAALLPALPRVPAGRIVLAPAQWRLDAAMRDAIARGDVDALQQWRKRWAVPTEVYFGQADNRLLLDLDDRAHVELLGDELRRLPAGRPSRVQEAIPARADAWLPGPHGRHVAEVMVSLVSSSSRPPGSDVDRRPARAGASVPVHKSQSPRVRD